MQAITNFQQKWTVFYGIIDYAQIHTLDARVERIATVNAELEEFIRLLKLHPELYPALRQILTPQEPLHEAQEAQPHKA